MRIGILGAGTMGTTHAALYQRMPGVEVAGIVGRRPGKVRRAARNLGVPGFTDPARILEDESVGAVDVAVPSGVHREIVVRALDHGKHVFCETPVALSLEDADAMIHAAKRRRRLLLVAQLMRFVPEYRRVHEVAAAGEMGRPCVALASRLSPPYWSRRAPRPFPLYGEPLLELSIFDFGVLNGLLGTPRRVYTQGVVGVRGAADHYVVTLHYPDGIGVVEGSARMPQSHPFNTRLRVLFERGVYEADLRIGPGRFSSTLIRFPARGGPRKERPRGGDPYRAECAYFVECVRGRVDPELLDARHDREALRVGLAARESLRRGAPVTLG